MNYSDNEVIQAAFEQINREEPENDFHAKVIDTAHKLLSLDLFADCDIDELGDCDNYDDAYDYIESTLEAKRGHNYIVTEWLTAERHTGQIEGVCDLLTEALTDHTECGAGSIDDDARAERRQMGIDY